MLIPDSRTHYRIVEQDEGLIIALVEFDPFGNPICISDTDLPAGRNLGELRDALADIMFGLNQPVLKLEDLV